MTKPVSQMSQEELLRRMAVVNAKIKQYKGHASGRDLVKLKTRLMHLSQMYRHNEQMARNPK